MISHDEHKRRGAVMLGSVFWWRGSAGAQGMPAARWCWGPEELVVLQPPWCPSCAPLCPAPRLLPPHLGFHLPSHLPFPVGTAFNTARWYWKRIILRIIIVLLQWLALTIYLFTVGAGRMPTGLPAQQQAWRLLEGCSQRKRVCLHVHTSCTDAWQLLAFQHLTLRSSSSFLS